MSGKCKLWFAPAVCVAAASAILSTRGDTYTVNAGETQTYDSITNTFALAADWPNNWIVKYASDGKSVYVYRQNGAQIIVR